MFNAIVVGVDGRQGGRDALALGERLRRACGGELIAVHAYHDEPFVTRGASPDFETVLHQNATELVESELERAGVTAHVVAMNDGSPGRALQRAAKWHAGDLIVVGSDRHGPIGRVIAGDVTMATLHGARCPVLVVPHSALDDTQDRARSRGRSLWTKGRRDRGRRPAIASSSRSPSHGAR